MATGQGCGIKKIPVEKWKDSLWDVFSVSQKGVPFPTAPVNMVVVGKHFTFVLIVAQWLKSNHLTAKLYRTKHKTISPLGTSTEQRGRGQCLDSNQSPADQRRCGSRRSGDRSQLRRELCGGARTLACSSHESS